MKLACYIAAATLAFGAGSAVALPGTGLSTFVANTASKDIERVTHNGSGCQLGANGWHYHWKGARYACATRPSGAYWSWVYRDNRWGWWSSREKRWH
jgi:hypothetical protein